MSTKPTGITDSRLLYYNNRISIVRRWDRWDTYVTRLVVRLSSYSRSWSGKRRRIMRKDHTVIVTLMLLTSWILRALMMSPTDILAASGAGAALTKARERSQRSPTYRVLDIIESILSSWEKVRTRMGWIEELWEGLDDEAGRKGLAFIHFKLSIPFQPPADATLM